MAKKHTFRYRDKKHQFMCGETVAVEAEFCLGLIVFDNCPVCGEQIKVPCRMRDDSNTDYTVK